MPQQQKAASLLIPNGKKVIYHFGRWHGFNAAFARLTDEKVTIIILGNKFNRSIYSTANKAYDIFGNYERSGNGGNDDDEEDDDVGETDLAAPAELGGDSDARPLFEKKKRYRENMQPVRSAPTTLAEACFHTLPIASIACLPCCFDHVGESHNGPCA